MGVGWARTWVCGRAWLGGTNSWASQGCGELEMGSSAVSLGRG